MAGVLIIMSTVGICALPAGADMTGRQKESEGERLKYRLKHSFALNYYRLLK